MIVEFVKTPGIEYYCQLRQRADSRRYQRIESAEHYDSPARAASGTIDVAYADPRRRRTILGNIGSSFEKPNVPVCGINLGSLRLPLYGQSRPRPGKAHGRHPD